MGTDPHGPTSNHDPIARISELKERMGRLSRQIGSARRTGEDTSVLIGRMKALSEECRQLETADSSTAAREPDPGKFVSRPNRQTRSELVAPDSAGHSNPGVRAADVCVTEYQGGAEGWDHYVMSHPRSSPYHLHCWGTILESSFAHPTHYLAARDAAGRLAGLLPMLRQKSHLFGHFMTSLPFLNYGGALGDSAEVEEALMRSAGAVAAEFGCRHVEFRDELARPGWKVREDKASMRLPLPRTPEELWAGFSSKLRAQIRRAERENPRIVIGDAELLPDFYTVFARNMRDLGTPVYARHFFENIVEHAGTPIHVAVTYLDQAPVSAGLLVQHKGRMEIPWASTVRLALPLGLNMYFYWRVLRFAIEQGSCEFDFGRSTVNSGPYRFKRQWGARPTPLHWHYWLADNESLPGLNPANPKYRALIATWRNLPVRLANLIGPMIARHLP